jgi:hypothetical protein
MAVWALARLDPPAIAAAIERRGIESDSHVLSEWDAAANFLRTG